MDTKQKILFEALRLFSEKGYSAVYIGEIADAVGIKAPSLYKHYKSKQDIFDSCVEVFSKRMERIRSDMKMPGTREADFSYRTVSEDKLADITVSLFLFYLKDDIASGFRKMLMIERYHNPEINRLFENLFIDGIIRYEEKIFSDLIDAKVIRKADPHIIALRFYTPVFYLLQKYDMHPERTEEAKEELISLVKEFCVTYKGSGK